MFCVYIPGTMGRNRRDKLYGVLLIGMLIMGSHLN